MTDIKDTSHRSVINDGMPAEITTYRPASVYPAVMAHITNMRPIEAVQTYRYITGCRALTAIKAVRHASKVIPGYCGICGKPAHIVTSCANEYHAADIMENGSCDVCGMFADQMLRMSDQCRNI